MPVLGILLIIIQLAWASPLLKGMELIQQGELPEGYALLEEAFLKEEKQIEKSKIARLLAYSPQGGTKASPVYYARFALKYHQALTNAEKAKLKLHIADSFMELGEFEKARQYYEEIMHSNPDLKDYVEYQLGYYYLNTRKKKKAFGNWWRLAHGNRELSSQAFKSIGRYWEDLGFLGDIKLLSENPSFMEGFSSFVDQRDEALTLKVLNVFVSKKASGQMLEMLVERNTLFVKDPCGFLSWYQTSYSLSNGLVFPYASQCIEANNSQLPKAIEVIQAQAASEDEKSFLLSLFVKAGRQGDACRVGYDEISKGHYSFIPHIFSNCEARSSEMVSSLRLVLDMNLKQYFKYLQNAAVIRSSLDLDSKGRKKFLNLLGERNFIKPFLKDEASFLTLMKDTDLTDESLLTFVLAQGRNERSSLQVKPLLKSEEAKELNEYLVSNKSFEGDVCTLENEIFQKLAIESKVKSGTLSTQEVSCSRKHLEQDKALTLLAIESLVSTSKTVLLKEGTRVSDEIMKSSEVKTLPSIRAISQLSKEWAGDIEILMKVQNYPKRLASSQERLLSALKRFRVLRHGLVKRIWHSKVIADKTYQHFNKHLDEFLELNDPHLKESQLSAKVSSFIEGMRLP